MKTIDENILEQYITGDAELRRSIGILFPIVKKPETLWKETHASFATQKDLEAATAKGEEQYMIKLLKRCVDKPDYIDTVEFNHEGKWFKFRMGMEPERYPIFHSRK